MDNEMNLTIPKDVVESAVRDKINSAIARELGDPAVLIKRQVEAALSQKVSANGSRSSSDYQNTYEFLETVATKFIQDAAKEALNEFFHENKRVIKEAVKKTIAKSPNQMAKVFMDSLLGSLDCKYGNNITIKFADKE